MAITANETSAPPFNVKPKWMNDGDHLKFSFNEIKRQREKNDFGFLCAKLIAMKSKCEWPLKCTLNTTIFMNATDSSKLRNKTPKTDKVQWSIA